MTRLLLALVLLLQDADVELDADRVPKTRTSGQCLIRNATLHTVSARGTIRGDLLVRGGKIAEIGSDLKSPEGISVIDGTDLHVMPGIIDCHSHIALDSINEGTQSVTPEVRVADVIDSKDVAIYRALAGGCTTAHLLHGSANTIGGQDAVVKLRWGKTAREMLLEGAPRGVKFALGENVVQANHPSNRGKRFPNTRLGVEATLRRAFTEAREYLAGWEEWNRSKKGAPPRKDLRLEALADILRGEIRVHCHCYRADEILMILRLAKEFGFRIATLQHALEAYKVAPEIAEAGVGVSTFADWWAFKIEAYDAIPYNAALLTRSGVLTSINSDSSNHIRRLNLEAAKAIKYGGLSEDEALRLVTLHPAKQLGIDARVGSIEIGKDADLAIFRGHPLSTAARCVMTLVDGEVFFERRGDREPAPEFRIPEIRAPRIEETKSEWTAIIGGTVYPVTAAPFRGVILVRDGKIAKLGSNVDVPPGARIVDATGLRVYPGLIDAETSLGLSEIGSIAGTKDYSEIGEVQPDLRAIAAVKADSEHLPVARANGITSAIVAPSGGLVAGQSSYIRLVGWTTRELVVRETVALHVEIPSLPEDKEQKEEPKPLKDLRELLQSARRYDPAGRRDLRLEALLPYVRGERPVVFSADSLLQIRAAIKLMEDLNLRAIISGGEEAWKMASVLAAKKIPVLLSVLDLPAKKHDPYDSAYFNAARLHRAGVRFAIRSSSSSDVRNLPYQAAMAAAYGLPRDEALKAITLSPSQILGLERGTLEEGRPADLMITTGDPLEIVSSVVYLMIEGKPVALETKQTRLYEKFSARVRR